MTVGHNNPNEQLSAFLDGELPAGESAELERQLAHDPALRLELEELAEVKRLVGRLPRVTAPASIMATLHEQLERRSLLHATDTASQYNWRWFRWMRIASAAAALVIVSALGYTVWRHISPPAGPIVQAPPKVEPAPGGERVANAESDKHRARPPAGRTMKDLAEGGKFDDNYKPASSDTVAAGGVPKNKVGDKELDPASAGGDDGTALGHEKTAGAAGAAGATGAAGGWMGKDGGHGGAVGKVASGGPGSVAEWRDRPAGGLADEAGSSRPLADQLAQGAVTAGVVRNHRFSNEPIVLDVPVSDDRQLEQLAAALHKTAVDYAAAVDPRELDKKTPLTGDDHQWIMEGKAGKNYTQTNLSQVQINVRVRNDVADKLIDQAQNFSNGQAQVQIRQGQLANADQAKAAEELQQRAPAFARNMSPGPRAMGKVPYDAMAAKGAGGPPGAGPAAPPARPAVAKVDDGYSRMGPAAAEGVPPPPTTAPVAVAPAPPAAVGPQPGEPVAPTASATTATAIMDQAASTQPSVPVVTKVEIAGCPAQAAPFNPRGKLNAAQPSAPASQPEVAGREKDGQRGQRSDEVAGPQHAVSQQPQGPRTNQQALRKANSARRDFVDLVINLYVPQNDDADRATPMNAKPAGPPSMTQPNAK